jgi:hypothetical protein
MEEWEMGNWLRATGAVWTLALLAACGAPSTTAPVKQDYTDFEREYVSIYGNGRALEPSSVRASSSRESSSGYAIYGTNRAVDGDLNTEWANAGWQERTASLTLSYDRVMDFRTVEIKTGPMRRSSYVFESSMDGYDWTPISGRLRNTTWDMETKDVSGRGRFLRVRWLNDDDPRGYFAIFEVQAFGRPVGGYSLQDPYAFRRW